MGYFNDVKIHIKRVFNKAPEEVNWMPFAPLGPFENISEYQWFRAEL